MKGFTSSEEIKNRVIGLKKQSLNYIGDRATIFRYLDDEMKLNSIEKWSHRIKPIDTSNRQSVQLLEIKKIVLNEEENIHERLVNVYQGLNRLGTALFLVIVGTDTAVKLYFGVRIKSEADSLAGELLFRSLRGEFQGIGISKLSTKTSLEILNDSISSGYVSVVSGIPSKREDNMEFVQGLEKYIDSMAGCRYTAVIIGEPVGFNKVNEQKAYLENLYSALSESAQWVLNYGEDSSTAQMKSTSKNESKTINTGTSTNHTTTQGSETSTTNTQSSGFSEMDKLFFNGLNKNKIVNESSGVNTTTGQSNNVSDGTTKSYSESNTNGTGKSKSFTSTDGDNSSIQVTQKNKQVQNLMDEIELMINRINMGIAFGHWNASAYFIGERDVVKVAANIFNEHMIGDNSYLSDNRVYHWNPILLLYDFVSDILKHKKTV